MNRKVVYLIAAAAVLVGCSGNSEKTQAKIEAAAVKAAPIVRVMPAQKQDVEQYETYSSTVQAYATNNIVPQSGNRIQKIYVEVGDFVSAGQVLAEMDRVQLDQAHLKYVNDSSEFDRVRRLFEQGGVSQSDFEAMELSCKVSRSTYQNLEENTILRSPINGVVTARNYDRGDMYSMSQPIFTVQQISPVKLLVAISESDYTRVKRGDPAVITTDAVPGVTFSGKVERIFPTVDAASHTVNVEIHVTNSNRTLRPGMYAKVKLTFGKNRSIVIPDSAVQKQQGSGQKIVFTLGDGDVAIQKFVKLGRHFESSYEVLEGLSEGEKVIVKGQSTLRDGLKVEVR